VAGLVLLLLLLASAIVTVVGILGLLAKLPPNALVGIRTPYTMQSRDNWYAVHRAAAPVLIWGGIAATMTSLAFLPFAVAGKLGTGLVSGIALAVAALLVASAVAGWLFGVRTAKRSAP
jgi:uncharacterized membrane protein